MSQITTHVLDTSRGLPAQDLPVSLFRQLDNNWEKSKIGSLKSLSAAYLTGYLFGKAAKEKVKEAILDMGMHPNVKKSRIYATVKGIKDSGFSIISGEDIFPDLEQIKSNKELSATFKKAMETIK